jgi:hypothetical protein
MSILDVINYEININFFSNQKQIEANFDYIFQAVYSIYNQTIRDDFDLCIKNISIFLKIIVNEKEMLKDQKLN